MGFSVNRFTQLLGVFATIFSFANGIDTITTKGRHFVNSNTGDIVHIPREFG